MIFTFATSNFPVKPDSRKGRGGVNSTAWLGVVSVGRLNWRVPFLNYDKTLIKMGTRVLAFRT